MPAIDPFHAKVPRIALGVAERYGFALGGGLTLVAHGVVDRPTEDVDLFSDREGSVPGRLHTRRADCDGLPGRSGY